MSIEKRQLLIEVEAGKLVCGDCDWHKGDTCQMFEVYLEDDCVRDPKCLAAEEKAANLSFDAAIAKAKASTAHPEAR